MRRARVAVLVAGLAWLGCGDKSGGGTRMPTRTFNQVYQDSLNRKLDLLFVVMNSAGMEGHQESLRANISRFMDVLKALPDGLPDLHVAVVSSDLGVGHNDIPGCNANGGDNGVFRSGVGLGATGCAATGLNAGATYVSTTGGQSAQNNFTGDITQVIQCIVPIGVNGCGFEQPLRSMARALGADGFQGPAENQGFLRPEAYLGIILLVNQDDCSATNNGFYDVASNTNLSSPLGPPGNFRCSEFGHLCDGQPPARRAPNGQVTDTVVYAQCVSSEAQGQLIPVSAFAAGVKSLKPDPAGQIVVASIQGPVSPYRINWKTPAVSTDPPWPEITHSCTSTSGGAADPGVRIGQFVGEFGAAGLVYSVCNDNYEPAVNGIAMKMSGLLAPKCIAPRLVDRDRDPSNGVQPDCAVRESVPDGRGASVEAVLPACASNGAASPCWTVRAPLVTESCPGGGNVLEIQRNGELAPPNTRVILSCAICIAGVPDPAAGCP